MADGQPQERCIPEFKYLFDRNLCKGKVAFITGGGSGIGFTIAEMLLRHGASVTIASRNEQRLKSAAAILEAETGGRCLHVMMDVRKPETIADALEATLSKFGRIDILVNNAAGNFLSPITGLSFNAFRTVMEIDTMGTFNTSKLVFEKWFQNHGGVIVNITATLAYRGTILQAHAGAAKAAIDALTKHMAMEWAESGVRVIGIAPGPIADTVGMRKLGGENTDYVRHAIPIGRVGTRADIGNAVLFVSSECGSFISGETIVVDGASWMSEPNNMAIARDRFARITKSKM